MVEVQVFVLFCYLTASMYLSEINLDLLPNNTNFENFSTYTHFSGPENRSNFNIMHRTVRCKSTT